MHDIFISYASDDRGRLTGLVAALEEQGWSVWWDHQSIQPGETWDETIEQAVKAAQCVVVAWSDASVRSRWVRAEAMVGLENGCLVPVLIDPVELPIAFKGT